MRAHFLLTGDSLIGALVARTARPGRLGVPALALTLLTVLSGCGTIQIPYDRTEEPKAQPVDGRVGIGAFVTEQGHLLTSKSFLRDCDYVTVNDQRFDLIGFSTKYDLALLRGKNPGKARIRFRTQEAAVQDEKATIYDAPPPEALAQVTRRSGRIKGVSQKSLLLDVKPLPRHAGGPVLDSQGLLLGTVSESMAQGQYAAGVPTSVIIGFLDSNELRLSGPDVQPSAAENARAIMPLQCWKKGTS